MNDNSKESFASLNLPVQWGDMDAAQHVNNTVYLRWMESTRIVMFQKMHGKTLKGEKIVPILAWQDCKYIYPVTFPDQISIHLDVLELFEDRVLCQGKIFSSSNNRLVAISKAVLMAYDMEGLRKHPFPPNWRESLIDFYGESILRS